MRKVARVKMEDVEKKWIILFATDSGVYVFGFATDYEGSSTGDDWYLSLADADVACEEAYGIGKDDWIIIEDPISGCQHDWISPVRVPGRDQGEPRWGTLERRVDGKWRRINPSDPQPTIEEAIQQSNAAGVKTPNETARK